MLILSSNGVLDILQKHFSAAQTLILNQYLKFQESPSLHSPHCHIILVTTKIDVIISNKNHPALISLLLSRVGASMAPSQESKFT